MTCGNFAELEGHDLECIGLPLKIIHTLEQNLNNEKLRELCQGKDLRKIFFFLVIKFHQYGQSDHTVIKRMNIMIASKLELKLAAML